MKRDTFSLRKTFLKPIANLSDGQLGRLFRAIYQYQCGEKPDTSDDISVYFDFFVAEFEEEEAKRRRRAEKAAERRRKKLAEAEAAKATSTNAKTAPQQDHVENSAQNPPEDAETEKELIEKCLAFKNKLQDSYYLAYLYGGEQLKLQEYKILIDNLSEEEIFRRTRIIERDYDRLVRIKPYYKTILDNPCD